MNSVGDASTASAPPVPGQFSYPPNPLYSSLQQRQGFAGKPAGHIAGKLRWCNKMKRLLYHNVEGAFNAR